MKRTLAIAAALVLFVTLAGSHASIDAQTPPSPGDVNANGLSDALEAQLATASPNDRFDVIVTFTGPGAAGRAQGAAQAAGARTRFRLIPGFAGSMTAAQIQGLARAPGLFRIELDSPIQLTLDAANRDFGTQAARDQYGVDGSGVGICIIDTGVHAGHEQFDAPGKIAGWVDLVSGNPAPYDDHGHGTHVANIAAGDGAGGPHAALYRGVAPGASLYVAKIFDSLGQTMESRAIQALDWCADEPNVDIISMSFTDVEAADGLDALSLAANAAADSGKIPVAGAGNAGDRPRTVGSPAAAEKVIAVGAAADWSSPSGSNGAAEGIYLAPFSSRGPTLAPSPLTKPDIIAPGVNIIAAATGSGSGYVVNSGTSMATPFAAGAIALAIDAAGGSMTYTQAAALLQESARDRGTPGKDNEYGWGLLDGLGLVARAAGGTGAHAFPASIDLEGAVPDSGAWEMTFNVVAGDLDAPIAATVITKGGSEVCRAFVFGICFSYSWDPDLSVELIDPAGTLLASGTCPTSAGCGAVSRQETVHAFPTVAGTYRLLVRPEQADPNFGKGGDFVVSLSNGALVNVTVTEPEPVAGQWKLDDGSGTVATDSSGNGYNGTLVNGPSWRAGIVGGALSFDGSNDRVDLPGAAADGLSDLTLAFWMQTTQSSGLKAIVSGATTGNDNELSVYWLNGTTLRFHTGETTGSFVDWNVPLANGAWRHVAIVRNAGANQATLYVDGVSVSTKSATLNTVSIAPNGFVLGQEQDAVGGGFDPNQAFGGSLDEVYLFGRLLTPAEIAALATVAGDSTPPSAPTGLTATLDGTSADLSWGAAADPESGIGAYRIYRDTVSGTAKTLVAEVPGTATTHNDPVPPGASYFYEVAAVNGHGVEGPRSNEASVSGGSTLMGDWSFDDGAGTVASDSSTYGHHGTLVDGPTWAAGRVGGALSFDGSNDRVDLPNTAANGLSDLTLAFWARTTQASGLKAIVSGATPGNDNEFALYWLNGTTLRFHTGETTSSFVEWAVPIADGAWHHIAIVRNAAGDTATLYVDGVSKGNRATPLNAIQIAPNGFVLGQEQDTVGGSFDPNQAFGGSLDELVLHSRLLSAAEIADLAGAADESPPAAPAGLVATINGIDVSLTWDAASDPESGIAAYRIYRDTDSGAGKALLAEVPGSQTSYVDELASDDVTYFYDVTAVNGEGIESAHSNEASSEGPEGPVAHWTFDDAAGTTAEDATGNGHDGVLVNGPVWAAGRIGGGLRFDGNDDRVDLPAGVLDGLSDLTISLWFRTTNRYGQGFVAAANTGNDNELLLYQDTRRRINFHTGEAPGDHQEWIVPSTSTNTWHHLLLVRDATTDRVTLYFNGVSMGSKVATLNEIDVDIGGLVLGQEMDGVGTGFNPDQAFAGTMDDVRIYDRVLSAAEIAALAAGN